MELIRLIHNVRFDTPVGLFLSTPLTVACLILTVWSLVPAIRGRVDIPFLIWLRLTWVTLLLPGVTGILLALGGLKVASATDAGNGATRYGFLPDPSRNWEHWMYVAFCLLSLYVLEVLVRGRLIEHQEGLRFLPVATLFLYGCAFMIGRVAVLPGSTPGT